MKVRILEVCLVLVAAGLCLRRDYLWSQEVAEHWRPATAEMSEDGSVRFEPYNSTAVYHVRWTKLGPLFALLALVVGLPGVLGQIPATCLLLGIGWHYAMWANELVGFWTGDIQPEWWPFARPTGLDIGALAVFLFLVARRTVSVTRWSGDRISRRLTAPAFPKE